MSKGFQPYYWWLGQSLILGPEFASKYAKSVYYARMDALNGTPFTKPDDVLFAINWEGTHSVFSPSDFPYWDEEVDDIEYMFVPRNEPEQTYLDDLYNAVCGVVRDIMQGYGAPMEPPSSYLFTPGPGKAYVFEEKTVDSYVADMDPKYDYFGTTLVAKRVKIPKKPGETRDGVVLFPPSRRSLRKVNWYLAWVANKLENCPYGKDMDYVNMLLDSFYENKKYFYQRDIEKCGLTLPHTVIATVNKAVFDTLGLEDIGQLAAQLFGQPVLHDYSSGEMQQRLPTRGHFLGMWSEGTTILQYALHRMNPYGSKVMFTSINDDQLSGCRSGEIMSLYADADRDMLARFHIPFKMKKTFISVGGLLYMEETRGVRSEKRVIWEKSAYNALAAHSIAQAKAYVNGLSSSAPDETDFTAPLGVLVNHFGYEFYQGEEVQPYLFGGWFTPYKSGCDATYDSYVSLYEQIRAYWSVTDNALVKVRTTKEYPTTSWGREIQAALLSKDRASDMIVSLVTTNGSQAALDSLYGDVFKTFSRTRRYYDKLAKERRQTYNSAESRRDIHPGWYARHPNSIIRFGCKTEGSPLDVAFTRTMDIGRAIDITYVILNDMNILRVSDKYLKSVKYSKKERWYLEKGYSPLIITGPGPVYWDRFHGMPEFFYKTGDFRPLQEAWTSKGWIITSHPESDKNLDGMAICAHIPVSLGNALMLREEFHEWFIDNLIAEYKDHFGSWIADNQKYTVSKYWRIVENVVDDTPLQGDDYEEYPVSAEMLQMPEIVPSGLPSIIGSDDEFQFDENGWQLPISTEYESDSDGECYDVGFNDNGSQRSWSINGEPESIMDW